MLIGIQKHTRRDVLYCVQEVPQAAREVGEAEDYQSVKNELVKLVVQLDTKDDLFEEGLVLESLQVIDHFVYFGQLKNP